MHIQGARGVRREAEAVADAAERQATGATRRANSPPNTLPAVLSTAALSPPHTIVLRCWSSELPASPRQTLAVHPRPRPRPRATACQATGRAAARSAVAPPSQHPRALAAQPAGLPYLRESLADDRFRHRAPQPVQFPDLDDVFHVRAQALGAEGEGPALALVRCLVVLDREGNGVLPQALVALGAHVWPLGQTAQGRL